MKNQICCLLLRRKTSHWLMRKINSESNKSEGIHDVKKIDTMILFEAQDMVVSFATLIPIYCCIILVRIVHPPMKTDPPAQPSPTQSILASFETNSGRWWIKLFKNQWIRFGCQFSQIEIQLNWPIQRRHKVWLQQAIFACHPSSSIVVGLNRIPPTHVEDQAVKIEVILGRWKLLIFFTQQGRNKFRFDPQTNSTRQIKY